jgi:endo-1,4-beta-xylanase
MQKNFYPLICLVAFVFLGGCKKSNTGSTVNEQPVADSVSLQYLTTFPVGIQNFIGLMDFAVPAAVVKKNFNRYTGAAFFWNGTEPTEGNFDFTETDKCLAFTESNGMKLHGHPLVYFQNGIVPSYISGFSGSKDEFEMLVKNHIQGIVSHYRGKIGSYDVVNEMVDFFNGGLFFNNYIAFFCTNDQQYLEFIGKCFTWAHEADPDAKLFYNEAKLEFADRRRLEAVMTLVNYLKTNNIPIHGIGTQMHTDIYCPIAIIDYTLQQLASTGLLVHISELDLSVNENSNAGVNYSYTSLTPALAQQQKAQYKAIVQSYRRHVPTAQQWGITLWDLKDNDSWLNQFRTEFPCLFDANAENKPAFYGFAEGLVQ